MQSHYFILDNSFLFRLSSLKTEIIKIQMIIIFWEMTPCGSYKNLISQKMIIIIVTAVETSNLT
jgi:hypothetical protein